MEVDGSTVVGIRVGVVQRPVGIKALDLLVAVGDILGTGAVDARGVRELVERNTALVKVATGVGGSLGLVVQVAVDDDVVGRVGHGSDVAGAVVPAPGRTVVGHLAGAGCFGGNGFQTPGDFVEGILGLGEEELLEVGAGALASVGGSGFGHFACARDGGFDGRVVFIVGAVDGAANPETVRIV